MVSRPVDAPRAFLSYARSDGEAFASALRARLETEHPEITLWQDRTRMEGGVGWWKQITEAIDQVEFLIMVLTPAALDVRGRTKGMAVRAPAGCPRLPGHGRPAGPA